MALYDKVIFREFYLNMQLAEAHTCICMMDADYYYVVVKIWYFYVGHQ
jgi:hypothetical protein